MIVLTTGGPRLECDALHGLAGARVTSVRVEREGDAACLAAHVRHTDAPEEFRDRMRCWGAARGWAVTVAPGRASR